MAKRRALRSVEKLLQKRKVEKKWSICVKVNSSRTYIEPVRAYSEVVLIRSMVFS